MKLRVLSLFFLVVFVCFASFETTHAQEITDQDVTLNISPESPGPFENVSVSLSSFAFDLNKSEIKWVLDGKTSLLGFGKKDFTFKSGDIGSATTLDIIIIRGETQINKKIIIRPAGLDLLWQAVDSHTPPFYKGKALPSTEGQVKVVAVPNIRSNGTRVADKDIVYNWKLNYKTMQSASGYGNSSFVFRNDSLNDVEVVRVQASTVKQGATAQGSLSVTPQKPLIAFYENNPLKGINYRQAIQGTIALENPEMSIRAEPYFFSLKGKNMGTLRFKWLVNNEEISTPADPNNIIFRKEENSSGSYQVYLKLENITYLFQDAKKLFTIKID